MPVVEQALAMNPAVVTISGSTNALINNPNTVFARAPFSFGTGSVIAAGHYSRFPVAWAALPGDNGIRLKITNNSLSAPIAPIICDSVLDPVEKNSGVLTQPIVAELQTVQPGQTIDELVQILPVSQMYLCLWYLSISYEDLANGGFSVAVQAWQTTLT